MSRRFSLNAQIDAVARAQNLILSQGDRMRRSAAEYEASVLANAVETLAWVRRHETVIRDAVRRELS